MSSNDHDRVPHAWVQWVAWGGLVLSGLFAFRELLSLQLGPALPPEVEPIEDFFFATDRTAPIVACALALGFSFQRIGRLSAKCALSHASGVAAAIGLSASMGCLVWARLTEAVQLVPLSFALTLTSLGALIAGSAGARSLVMPGIFVALFATPFPAPLLNWAMSHLQLATAEAVTLIVRVFEPMVQQAGDLIVTPWATFQVIETCAGLRALDMLMMATFVLSELLEVGWRRRVALLMLAPVVAAGVNVLRVLLLVVKPSPDAQPDHSFQGIVMLMLGVFVIALANHIMERADSASQISPAPPPSDLASSLKLLPIRRTVAASVLFLLVGVGVSQIEPWPISPRSERTAHDLPRQIGAWRMLSDLIAVDEEYLGNVRFSSRTWRRYVLETASESGQVEASGELEEMLTLFVGQDDGRRGRDSIVSGKTLTLLPGTFRSEHVPIELASGQDGVEALLRTKSGGTLLARHWYENVDDVFSDSVRWLFGIERSPLRHETSSWVFRIATGVEDSVTGRMLARAHLLDFESNLILEFEALEPSR